MNMETPIPWHQLPNAPRPGTALCRLEEIADGGVRMVSLDAGPGSTSPEPFRLLLVRSDQSVVAFVNRCAHFGVPLSQTAEHLRFDPHVSLSCNVHYARFRWQDGYCIHGDCEGESLIPVDISLGADGRISITE